MDNELQIEFQSLVSKAHSTLRKFAESGSFIRVFSIIELPSFDSPYAWSIYSPQSYVKDRPPFAHFSIWRKDIDSVKFNSPVERLKYPSIITPTIMHDSINLSAEWLKTVKDDLSEIKISIFNNDSNIIGLDGTSYEFYYSRPYYSCNIKWWENNPENWKPFTKYISTILEYLDDLRINKIEKNE